jgi:ribosomal protein L11 methyltransferase
LGSGRTWPALDVSVPAPARRDLVLALLDDFHPTAIDESGPWLRAFFGSFLDRDAAARALASQFSTSSIDVADEGWAERSQASLRAIRAGDLIVAPPWDIPADGDASQTIVIRPSMGFGTGHHATTRLCLSALQTLPLAGARVVDVGTGSGVLAIAAARRGAAEVLAVDTDQDAIDCARENVDVNGVAAHVKLMTLDVRDVRESGFDLLIANLTGALLRISAETLLRMVRAGGHLVLSGFLLHEEDEVAGRFGPPAQMIRRDQEDEWGVLVLRTRVPGCRV